MGAVVDPFARCSDPLAGGNYRGVPDHRDQSAVAACPDPQNAEPVLFIVVGDALDEAGQNFLGWWFCLRSHADHRPMALPARRLKRIRKSIWTIRSSNSLFLQTNSLFLRRNSLFH